MPDSIPSRQRLFDIVITALLAVLGSAASTAFIIFPTVTRLSTEVEEHSRRLDTNEAQVRKDSAAIAALQSRSDGQDRINNDIERQLSSIDSKVDRLIEVQARR